MLPTMHIVKSARVPWHTHGRAKRLRFSRLSFCFLVRFFPVHPSAYFSRKERKRATNRSNHMFQFHHCFIFFSFELFIQFIQFIHQFIFRNIQKYKLERERDAHRWKRFQLFPKLLLPVIIYYYSSVRIILAKNFNCQWIVTIIKRIERDGKIDTLNFQV